ncbi:MAG: HAD family hydrolase [Thermoplasmata archaeon]
MPRHRSTTYDGRARLIRSQKPVPGARHRGARPSAGSTRTRPAGRHIAAFASDLDRTLLRPHGRPTDAGRSALREARASGLRTLLVSGREYAELLPFVRRFGSLDGIVAENGAVVEAPLGTTPVIVGRTVAAEIRRRVREISGVRARFGRVVASVPLPERARLTESLRGLPVRLIANVDRLMALPDGVDKGTGIHRALRRLGLGQGGYAAIGDAENDLDLLRGAELSGAVRNAEAIVRATVDYECRRSFSDGVLEFVRGPLAARMLHDPHAPGSSGALPGPGRAPR